MPADQLGSVVKLRGSWGVRYYDEQGKRKRQAGFETKSAATSWLSARDDEVAALRRGDVAVLRRRDMPTLGELVDEFLAQHNAEANTLRTLRERLRYATEGPARDGLGGFKAVRIAIGSRRTRSARGGSGSRRGPRGGSTRRSGKSCTTRCGRSCSTRTSRCGAEPRAEAARSARLRVDRRPRGLRRRTRADLRRDSDLRRPHRPPVRGVARARARRGRPARWPGARAPSVHGRPGEAVWQAVGFAQDSPPAPPEPLSRSTGYPRGWILVCSGRASVAAS
jgi:hypothetical protein